MSGIVSENKFFGLWQGPIDHDASTVINAIYDTTDPTNFAVMGDSVFIQTSNDKLLPEVNFVGSTQQEFLFYGILVGGDKDGIYPTAGDTPFASSDTDFTIAFSGDTVRVCTQGRCVAAIDNEVTSYNVGDPLKAERGGDLRKATSGSLVVARALQKLDATFDSNRLFSYMAVDIQREGILP